MNWDQVEVKWKQFTESARERWGRLTDNDWQVAGKKEHPVGRIQERYGVGGGPKGGPSSGGEGATFRRTPSRLTWH